MAKILEFRASRPSEGERPRRISDRSARGGEIVIFPGVRYERWHDGAEASAPAPIVRDTLQLAE